MEGSIRPANPEQDYRFGPFVLQRARRRLLHDGAFVPLGSRAFDVLAILVEEHGSTVSQRVLLQRVWTQGVVEENNLTVTISALRRALCEKSLGQTFIQTVPRQGYRFVGEVTLLRIANTAVAETPSIAVLPFASGSADPDQLFLGEGIAEDIIAVLSQNRWLTVIAHSSSRTVLGTSPEVSAVARQLGVRYVLEGSFRTIARRVRVTAQLTDVATNTPLIAQRYDRERDDFFTARDEIAELITLAVRPALMEAEQRRSIRKPPDNVDAWTACQRGSWHLARFGRPEAVEARAWFQRAIELDPQFAPGYSGLALAYLYEGSAWLPGADPHWQPRGESLALQAVVLDDRDSGALSVLGIARMVRGDHVGALDATDRALALNPNEASAHGTRGATLVFAGRPLEGLEALARFMRLSPRDPRLRIRRAHAALGHFFADQPAEAEAAARAIMAEWPDYSFGPRLLTIILAEAGRLDEAAHSLQQAQALEAAPFDDYSHARMPWYRRQDHRRVVAALRRAGWTGCADDEGPLPA